MAAFYHHPSLDASASTPARAALTIFADGTFELRCNTNSGESRGLRELADRLAHDLGLVPRQERDD